MDIGRLPDYAQASADFGAEFEGRGRCLFSDAGQS